MTRPADEMTPSPFVQMVGAKIEGWSEGYARMSLVMEAKHMNPNGVSHGGVLTTLMDEVAGAAIGLVRGLDAMQGAPHATVEMNTSFMSGPRVGDEIVVEGRALKVGRSVAFAEAEVRRRGREGLVAKGRFTYVIMEPRGA